MGAFDDLVQQATGHQPYPYQRLLADKGLVELLAVPTGTGKTLAAVLPWLYRRRQHHDPVVQSSTPRRLVLVLPVRVLVEQTHEAVHGWLDRLGLLDDIGLHVLRGGEGKVDDAWRLTPERDCILIGTLDMILSRTLNRGFAMSRYASPIDFGLLTNDCHFVYDEVQLFGPALPTSRQLAGLRRVLGTAKSCSDTWMSATVDEPALATVDNRAIASRLGLGDADRTGALRGRLDAQRTVREFVVPDPKKHAETLAQHVLTHHRPGTLTLVVVNTVRTARDVVAGLGPAGPPTTLLHSRFRPGDRAERVAEALAQPPAAGRIVVSTQVLEAGVDISSAVMVTEAAVWPSVVQRAGRCNRDGTVEEAELWWVAPEKAAPYDDNDVAATVAALRGVEGQALTSSQLGAVSVLVAPVVHPVLRRRDLLELFDTTPDILGNDLDISRFLRDSDDLDVSVAWRDVPPGVPVEQPAVTAAELCPVPVGEIKAVVKAGRTAWLYDRADGQWRVCRQDDVRPGQVLLMQAADGGYEPERGWDPAARSPVPVLGPTGGPPEQLGGDQLSTVGRWVPLVEHLTDVERECRRLLDGVSPVDLAGSTQEAMVVASRLHDIGKVHPVFQASLVAQAPEGEREARREAGPWAKSGGRGRLRHSRPYFRHELVSALLLDQTRLLEGVEQPDLVRYLVAAHHGKVRVGLRPAPEEPPGYVLGVRDGDKVPDLPVPGGVVPAVVLRLVVDELGDTDGGEPSWTARTLALRDRADLGPFRLGFAEAIVRLADWVASRAEEVEPA